MNGNAYKQVRLQSEPKTSKFTTISRELRVNKFLYLLILPGISILLVFNYIPMFGIIIAFQDFNIAQGFFHSPFVGLKHFFDFFNSTDAYKIIKNSILLNVYSLLWGFAAPIIFAIALNELRLKFAKRVIQTVSYLPHFLSTVIIVGIINMLLSLDSGVVNSFISEVLGMEKIYFLIRPEFFRSIYVVSGIWQSVGWAAIIYLATIVSIDPQLYEAATVDGASRMQRIIHITLPGLKSTILVMLILSLGGMMSVGFEKVYLLSVPLTYDVSDVVATYVYRRGLGIGTGIPDYSFASAVGLFESVINATLLVAANWVCRKALGKSIY